MITDEIEIIMEFDERKREMTFITPNDDKKAGITRKFIETYSEEALRNFWESLKKQKQGIQDVIQRNEKLISDIVDKTNLIKKDLKKQEVVVEEKLTPELEKFKENLKAVQEWDQIHGKPKQQIETARSQIDEKKTQLKIMNQRMENLKAKARSLNLK